MKIKLLIISICFVLIGLLFLGLAYGQEYTFKEDIDRAVDLKPNERKSTLELISKSYHKDIKNEMGECEKIISGTNDPMEIMLYQLYVSAYEDLLEGNYGSFLRAWRRIEKYK